MVGGVKRSRWAAPEATVSAGQIFTDQISVRLGDGVTRLAIRVRLFPTHLTLCGLVVGLASAVALAMAPGSGSLLLQVSAVLGWQLAYVFDCADGQLARITHTASEAGGELDVLVDVAVQWALLTVTASVAVGDGGINPTLVGIFVASWPVSMVMMLLSRVRLHGLEPEALSEALKPRTRLVLLTRQLRDYPLNALALSAAVAFSPRELLPWVLAWLTAVNVGILGGHIVARSRRALHSGAAIRPRSAPPDGSA
jgi:phosphatidylglycerophosphate synthase